jgi:enoyl-CoA hydratase/carnithine racemase
MSYSFQTLQCSIENYIAEITLNAPPMNLLSVPMLQDLRDLMSELGGEKDLRCIIITGAGDKAFCAGANVGEYTDPTIDQLEESDVWARNILTRFSNISCPTIAAINGYALGGGLELALACDIRIASESAKMGLVETKIGLVAGWGGSQRLPRIVGVGAAKRMMFAAEKLDANQSLHIGLVQEVHPADKLIAVARELAAKIAGNSPVSNRLTKEMVNFYMNQNIMEGLDLERHCDRMAYISEDSKEGMAAFEEKRTANFKNC